MTQDETPPHFATVTDTALTPEQGAVYAAAVEQTEAIFALDGMHPTAQDKAVTAAIVAGRVAPEQARREFIAYVTEHKTVRGFIESRPWAIKENGAASA